MRSLARLARGFAALCALLFLTTVASGQTSYTISPGGSVTLSSTDQAGLSGGGMANRNVYFTNGSLTVWGSGAGSSPVSTFKQDIDGGVVTWTHNGDGATQVFITITDFPYNGSRTVTVNITQSSAAPSITLQPQSVTICEGPNILLRSAADGSPVPTPQWQRSTDDGATWANETLFQTGTSDTLLLSSSIGLTGWRFRTIYTNSIGSDTTDEAIITTQQNYILTHPQDTTLCAGGTVTWAPSVVGVGDPGYQWQVSVDGGDWTDLPGDTTQTLVLVADTSMHGNRYRLALTNGACGTSATNGALLTVNYPPTVTTQPLSLDRCAGQTATFTVAANGRPAARWVWQHSANGGATWTTRASDTLATLSLIADTAHDGYRFRAIASNVCGIDTSDAATLTVGSAPTITAQPQPDTVCTGHSTTLTVTAVAAGSSPLAYQWRRDGTPIDGANASSYTITNATDAVAGSYDVVVTACATSTTSTAVAVTVLPPPALSVTLDRTVIASSVRSIVPIGATVTVTGGCSPQVVLDQIVSSEADGGVVTDDLTGDIVADSLDLVPAERAFGLRAEAGSNGRIYSVTYRITDGSWSGTVTKQVAALPSTSTVGSGPQSTSFTLTEASPNPATESTSFSFSSATSCAAKVIIYSPSGAIVKTLISNYLGTGTTVTWDLTNTAGTRVPAGIYVYYVKACSGMRTGAIIVE